MARYVGGKVNLPQCIKVLDVCSGIVIRHRSIDVYYLRIWDGGVTSLYNEDGFMYTLTSSEIAEDFN